MLIRLVKLLDSLEDGLRGDKKDLMLKEEVVDVD